MAMAGVVDAEPGEEVEVLAPVGVPQPRAVAPHELDRRPRVGVHRVAALETLKLVEAHGVTIVPMPASVKSSRRRECGRRPSTICAEPTPERTASTQAPSLGRIPPETESSAASTSPTGTRERSDDSSSGLASHPATSVRKIALNAPSAPATLPAAVS